MLGSTHAHQPFCPQDDGQTYNINVSRTKNYISSECSRQRDIEYPVKKVMRHLFTMKTGIRTQRIWGVLCQLSQGKDAFLFPLKELALFVCTCFRSVTGNSKGKTKAVITMRYLLHELTFFKLSRVSYKWMCTAYMLFFNNKKKRKPWSSYTKRGHQGIKEVMIFAEAKNEITWSLKMFGYNYYVKDILNLC